MVTKRELWDILKEIDSQAPLKELIESDVYEPLQTTDIWIENYLTGRRNYVFSNIQTKRC